MVEPMEVDQNSAKLDLGNYNFEKRKRYVLEELDKYIYNFDPDIVVRKCQGLLAALERSAPADDLLSTIEEAIVDLKWKADQYNDRHINQEFREVNAKVSEFQVKLDKFSNTADDEDKPRIKKAIMQLDKVADTLWRDIHQEHKTCGDCKRL